MVAILMMSTKVATLGLFKIKVIWNKCYDIIVYIELYCTVDVVMWPKFGNSTIPMKEVIIITSIV